MTCTTNTPRGVSRAAWQLWLLLTALLNAGAASPAAAQQSGLEALLSEADSMNPQILAAERSAEAELAQVPQAGALPDPMLGIGLMNVPLADPSLGREMMTMAQVQLGTTLPWPGKLGFREDIARLEAEAAGFEVRRVRQRIQAQVKTAYYRVYFVDRAMEVTSANSSRLSDFVQITSSKYSVGNAAQSDVLKAQVEETRLVDQLVALREQRVSALAGLNTLLGRPSASGLDEALLPDQVRRAALAPAPGALQFASSALASVLPPDGDVLSPTLPTADLQTLALAHNPMLLAHMRRVGAQKQAVSLAETATLPDFRLSAGYSFRSGFTDFFSVTVSAPLPIFSGRKQNQGVVERAAILGDHQARQSAMVDQVNGEIESLAAELRRARDQLVLLDEGILPQARTGLSSATASYQVGRVDFLTLLDAQVTLYRHELDYHRLLADFATNLAALERAVGTEVLR
jgi:outer membrane protein, heavy metal efflux system